MVVVLLGVIALLLLVLVLAHERAGLLLVTLGVCVLQVIYFAAWFAVTWGVLWWLYAYGHS